jgi:hypothetical protein
MVYSLALFLHVVGALGLFVALGLEWTALLGLRRAATAEQAREWLSVFARLRWLYPVAVLAILVFGIAMVALAWGPEGWVVVGLGAMVLMAVLGVALTGRRVAGIGRSFSAEQGALSPAYRERLRDPALKVSLQARAAIALGIVFVMTVKPDLAGSLAAIGVAAILGLAASWAARGAEPRLAGAV